MTYREAFKAQLLEIVEKFPNTTVALVPSLRDVQHDQIFPQPSIVTSLGKR
jgi:hypothetical protein